MFSRLREIWSKALGTVQGDQGGRFDHIQDALEDGDLETVFTETDKIISRNKYLSRVMRRRTGKAMMFNSSEEYNNYLIRFPAQSHIGWEYPLEPEAHYHRAMAFQRSGRLKSSCDEIDKSLRGFPNSAKYLVERGYILLHMKDYGGADASFDRAIENDLTGDLHYTASAFAGKGFVRVEQGRFAEAKKAFAQARRLDPENRETAGHLHLVAELETDPRQRAEHLLGLGNYGRAVDAFEDALSVNPGDFDMHMGIAFSYKELQRYQEAEKHLRRAFQLNPENSQVNFALGWVYLMQEKTDLAEAEIRRAIHKNPYDPGYYVGLAYVYLDRVKAGALAEGDRLMSALRKAIDLDPSYPEPNIVLAEYNLVTDRLDLARTSVRNALKLSPTNQGAHIIAAEIFLEKGDRRKSLHHLREAAEFGRDNEEMRQLRERLDGDSD